MTVQVGQIWADNDKRAGGRQIRVDRIDGDYATCTVVADRAEPEQRYHGRDNVARPPGWTAVGFKRRILLRRFKPTATGYRLIGDTQQ